MPGPIPTMPVFRGLPGPMPQPTTAAPGPMQPYGLFPTTVKVGDVMNVTGPFAGKFQGQVLVRFAGGAGIAPALTGPFGGSVVVPPGAQSGSCTIEVDGRTVFGTSCVVSKGLSGGRPPAGAPQQPWARSWYGVGPKAGNLGAFEGAPKWAIAAGAFLLLGGAWLLYQSR